VKIAVVAPTPSARVTTAVAAKPGDFLNRRSAYFRFASMSSTADPVVPARISKDTAIPYGQRKLEKNMDCHRKRRELALLVGRERNV
jgi:hypothetical protein